MTTAHEPRSGPGAHLSAEDLSALAEGAQPTAAGAVEHLVECDACRGEVDAMSELLAQFEEWDVPAMPQEVAIRIDAALARESAARAAMAGHPAALASGREASASSGLASAGAGQSDGASRKGTPGAKSSGSPAHSRRRRWLPGRGLGWALASLVLIAGGVGLALKLVSSGGVTASTAVSSGSAASQPYAATNGGQGANGPSKSGAGSGDSSPRSLAQRAADTQLSAWTLQALSNHPPEATINSPCLSDPAFTGSHDVALANGTYNGTPATLIVYANPADASTVIAVVYATPCTTTNYRVLDQGTVAK